VIREMMDHERTEKELQQFFEEIQRSYDAFAEDAFALQERTLEFARGLLENATEREAEGMQATLEELAEKSRGERQRFEKLARKSSEAYMRVLKGPVDEHHHKIEEAKSALDEASSS
jgi:ketosteroid isomerase-like protein